MMVRISPYSSFLILNYMSDESCNEIQKEFVYQIFTCQKMFKRDNVNKETVKN